MKKALFAGSFDPPTLGHLNIITRALALCDELYIALAQNEEKKGKELFSFENTLSRATQKKKG
jgi:pantetheine-phosphate adenylyltransferase